MSVIPTPQEKVQAVVGSNVLVCLMSLVLEAGLVQGLGANGDLRLSFPVIFVALLAVPFFRKVDLPEEQVEKSVVPLMAALVTNGLNCLVAVVCKGMGKGILNAVAATSIYPLLPCFYIGGLAGCALYQAVKPFRPRGFMILSNTVFFTTALGLFCNTFSPRQPLFAVAFALLLGIGSAVGMMQIYYVVGMLAQQYDSLGQLRLSIVLVGICGGVAGVLTGRLVSAAGAVEASYVPSLLAIGGMMIALFLSPFFPQQGGYERWGKHIYAQDSGESHPAAETLSADTSATAQQNVSEKLDNDKRKEGAEEKAQTIQAGIEKKMTIDGAPSIQNHTPASTVPFDLPQAPNSAFVPPKTMAVLYNLTPREAQVCKLLLQGYTLRQIAGILILSPATVNTYCTALYRKLNINSRIQLLLLAQNHSSEQDA